MLSYIKIAMVILVLHDPYLDEGDNDEPYTEICFDSSGVYSLDLSINYPV